MSTNTWMMVATSGDKSFVAQTTINDQALLYRALSKWLIRGSASTILDAFWEYIDQYDNELEDALLDQLVTQAERQVEDPQITNVRTKDYAIDLTVSSRSANESVKTCSVDCVLFVYFHSLKKKLRIDEKSISVTLVNYDGKVEKVMVAGMQKTPSHMMKKPARRVSKRSSKELPKGREVTPTPMPLAKSTPAPQKTPTPSPAPTQRKTPAQTPAPTPTPTLSMGTPRMTPVPTPTPSPAPSAGRGHRVPSRGRPIRYPRTQR